MKTSTRAVIFSLLIFPGAGLWVLGEKRRALVFIIPTTIALIILMKRIMEISQPIMNDMMESFSLDFKLLFYQVHTKIYHDHSIRNILWFLLAAFVLSSISSYFVGRKLDLEKKS